MADVNNSIAAAVRGILDYLRGRHSRLPEPMGGPSSSSSVNPAALAKIDLSGRVTPGKNAVDQLARLYAGQGAGGAGMDDSARLKRLEEVVEAILQAERAELSGIPAMLFEQPGMQPGDESGGRQTPGRHADGDTREKYRPMLLQETVLFGTPASAYSSGATISLTPCDVAGVATGADAVTVQAGWTLPATTTIAITEIIPYQRAANGNYYVIGNPKLIVTDAQLYDATTSIKVQKKMRLDFGAFSSTETGWVDSGSISVSSFSCPE